MSYGLTLLDELEFVQAELTSKALPATVVSTLRVPIAISGSPKPHFIAAPLFVRSLNSRDMPAAWRTFCALLRKHGIPLFSPVAALSKVSAAEVPARWSGRDVDQPFTLDELTTADLFEVRSHDHSGQLWQWPVYYSSASPTTASPTTAGLMSDKLASLISSVRLVAGGDVPIGICLPLGCQVSDLRNCLSADVDFISLVSRRSELSASDLCSLVQCRQLCEELNRPTLPLLVSAPVVSVDHVAKLLALGATAISIDAILKPIIQQSLTALSTPQEASDLRRKLPSLALAFNEVSKPLELPELDVALGDVKLSLVQWLRWIGVEAPSKLNRRSLRSTSERAQQVTGTARLTP